MEKFFFIFLEIFLKSACRKFTAILKQNFKVNVDQHASKSMWLYGLRKKFFGRCLLIDPLKKLSPLTTKQYWIWSNVLNMVDAILAYFLLVIQCSVAFYFENNTTLSK